MVKFKKILVVGCLSMVGSILNAQDTQEMSFFVTSVGSGDGGNLGGLMAADRHCQALAEAAGATAEGHWHAYLSQAAAGNTPAANARDRIGSGPWFNVEGSLIASNVDDLHLDLNNIRKPTALDENGNQINGSGDSPNQHDVLTGSDSQGRVARGNANLTTCGNWTDGSDDMHTVVGHTDRLGGPNASWNSVHSTRGCSQQALVSTGGNGLFYCFRVR
jgi:hypothetical protein